VSSSSSSDTGSPCIKVCVLDAANVCIGCGRHVEEIANWSRSTPEQRRSICEQAARRQAQRPIGG
jgi:uncharacterized protein